jgi:hypothetical protein
MPPIVARQPTLSFAANLAFYRTEIARLQETTHPWGMFAAVDPGPAGGSSGGLPHRFREGVGPLDDIEKAPSPVLKGP